MKNISAGEEMTGWLSKAKAAYGMAGVAAAQHGGGSENMAPAPGEIIMA